jgi:hypothetical protein
MSLKYEQMQSVNFSANSTFQTSQKKESLTKSAESRFQNSPPGKKTKDL